LPISGPALAATCCEQVLFAAKKPLASGTNGQNDLNNTGATAFCTL